MHAHGCFRCIYSLDTQLLMDLMRDEVQEAAVIAAGLAQLLNISPAAFSRNCK
jgi:hypothetical protein